MGKAIECPVDGSPAKDIAAADHDGLAIRCQTCGDFEVNGSAKIAFLALDLSGRRRALQQAKIRMGNLRPSITGKDCR